MRTRLARSVVRAAVEVERSMGEPRFQVRRDGDRVLVALTQDLAGYAFRLGEPCRQAGRRKIRWFRPSACFSSFAKFLLQRAPHSRTSRLIRLAAAASSHVGALQPPGALSQGDGCRPRPQAVAGCTSTVSLRSRSRRFASGSAAAIPKRHALPDRPALDTLAGGSGIRVRVEPRPCKGVGGYESRYRDPLLGLEPERVGGAPVDGEHPGRATEITPEIADARQFEERLRHGIKEGSFYTLLVNPKYYQRAYQELCRRFPIELVDFEELFLKALRQVVDKAGAKWDAVVSADATPGDGKWDKFMVLVKRAMPIVEEQTQLREEADAGDLCRPPGPLRADGPARTAARQDRPT